MKRFLLPLFLLMVLTAPAQQPSDRDSLGGTVTESPVLPGLHSGIPVVNKNPQKARSRSFSNDSGSLRLQRDDLMYNPRADLWQPVVRVMMVNIYNWAKARYIENASWAGINMAVWKKNLRGGLAWDKDGLFTNMFGHPYTGSKYYNVARSNGYTPGESFLFTTGGSIIWEYFGENETPSRNDLISTPLGGFIWGEILYRLSSVILDDRKKGFNRVCREAGVAVFNKTRSINRLTSKKMFRVTPVDVYQKEQLETGISSGLQRISADQKFPSGKTNLTLGIIVKYGDPFTVRSRHAFDFFFAESELRLNELSNGITSIAAYGFLFGKSRARQLTGIFQHYDYWDFANLIALSSIGFGPGIISTHPAGKSGALHSQLFITAIPIVETRPPAGHDTSVNKVFHFGGGMKGFAEESLEVNKWLCFKLRSQLFYLFSFDSIPGTTRYLLVKPGIQISICRNTSLHFEHQLSVCTYTNNKGYYQKYNRTEQRLFIRVNF